MAKVVVSIPMKISFFNVVLSRVYIQKKFRLIELWMQGSSMEKIDFSEIIWITYEFMKLIIVDHYFVCELHPFLFNE
jgi:hypothetical protein